MPTQTIIVYRSPAEQMFWEWMMNNGGVLIPFLFAFFAWAVTWYVTERTVYTFFPRKRSESIAHLFAIIAALITLWATWV